MEARDIVHIRLDRELREQLARLAAEEERPLSSLVRLFLRREVQRQAAGTGKAA